jgi:rhamnosyl/mannosyltransferase
MENFLESLCQGLARAGVQCEVIVAGNGEKSSCKEERGVLVRRMGSLGTIRSLPICPEAIGALLGLQADIINLHHPNPLADLSYILAKPKGRLVVTYHSDIVGQRCLTYLHAPFLHRVLQRADAIVATSPQYVASSEVLRNYHNKIHTIPLGFDAPPFGEIKPLTLNNNKGPKYFFIGRLVPYKGVSVMVEALKQVPGHLWIAGTGPLEGKLRRQVGLSGLNERVEFLGNISEREKFTRLKACDVFVLPSISRAEAFGVALLEAMAMGKPLVVSDLPTGVSLLVQNGVNGHRFPPGDAKALAAILLRLANNPQDMMSMGRASQRLVQEKYTTNTMINSYLKLYEGLMHLRDV